MRISFFLFFVLLWSLGCKQQTSNNSAIEKNADGPKEIEVVFYNVENLFDTKDDPDKMDDDFTPAGRNNWTDNRYDRKISQLAKVFSSMIERHQYLPAVIGLAEVENKQVVLDLAKAISKSGHEYRVVHEESLDDRGIDVALMYRSDIFQELSHDAFRIKFEKGNYRSRDILNFKGQLYNGETVDFFINHWPSRREGAKETEHKRIAAAKTLKAKVNALLKKDDQAKIIILGDFNDYPDNKSILEVMDATGNFYEENDLYNLAFGLNSGGEGSYNYRGDWGMLDQAIVSSSLLEGTGLQTTYTGLEIYKENFMMYYDKKYKEHKPNRTYGSKYFGGYSDHLPIVVQFSVKNW